MSIHLTSGDTILFTGDSITDCGRRDPDGAPLGNGYVSMAADELATRADDLTVINTGIGGNRAVDLQSRWQFDCIDHRPDVLSIMIGINDTWRRYDADSPTSAEAFEASYRDLLERVRAKLTPQVVLLEPFLTPVTDAQRAWRDDLDPKIEVVRVLAGEYGATLLQTDAIMNEAVDRIGAASLAADGVHPTAEGHRILADAWLGLLQGT